MTVEISAIRSRKRPPNQGGTTPLAQFNFITADVAMKGCILAKNVDGKWRIWPPKLDTEVSAGDHKSSGRTVFFPSGSPLLHAVTEAAVKAYEALGVDR